MLGTAGAGTNITNTDIYGTAATDELGTTAYYYNFKIDYMISTSSKDKLKIGVDNVKVYKDGETNSFTPGEDDATLDKATRVAFRNASSYASDSSITYAETGTEYAIAKTCATTDHNLNALQELGYAGTTSEYTNYDNGQTVLDNGATNVHKVSTPEGTTEAPTKTTSDGSFTYGSVDVYVWFDGTDKACTNAIFS